MHILMAIVSWPLQEPQVIKGFLHPFRLKDKLLFTSTGKELIFWNMADLFYTELMIRVYNINVEI